MDNILTLLMPSLDITVLMVMMVTFLLSGIVKGFLGIGLPAAAMGLLTLVTTPTHAIALLTLPIIFSNLTQFSRAANKIEVVRTYWAFALAIMLAIFFTSIFINRYPTSFLTISIGIAMIIFALNGLYGIRLPIGPGRGWQIGFGIASGVLGGLSSIWSPTVAMYLLARNLEKDDFIAATGFLFLAGCFPLAFGLYIAGTLTPETMLQSLIGMCVVLTGFRIGEVMRNHVPQDTFRKIVLVAFLLMGFRLIAVGVF